MGLSFFPNQPFLLSVSRGTGFLAKPGFGFIPLSWVFVLLFQALASLRVLRLIFGLSCVFIFYHM